MAGKSGGARKARSVAPLRRALAIPETLPGAAPRRARPRCVATSVLTLSLPIAVRRVVDNFFAESLALVDAYFLAALGIAALLALGTAARYYLVTRLGERVIADIRRGDLRPRGRPEPGLLRADHDRRGALAADHRHDAGALGRRLVGVDGAPQPADADRRARAPVRTSPKLTGARARRRAARARADPRARAAAARRSAARARTGSPRRARRPRESLLRGADRAGLHPRGREPGRFGGAGRALVRRGAAADQDAGGADARSSSSSSSPRSSRCSGSARATCARAAMSPGELVQFVIYAVIVAGSVAALSEIWGELQRAAGATERMVELIDAVDTVARPGGARCRCRGRCRGAIAFEDVTFRYPARPETAALDDVTPAGRAGRDRGAGRAVGRRQDHGLPAAPALLRPRRRAGHPRRRRHPRRRAHRPAPAARAGAAGAGDLRRRARARTSASAGPRPATPRSRRRPARRRRTSSSRGCRRATTPGSASAA